MVVVNYEKHLNKLKEQERAKPRYNWPLVAALGLLGVGLLANGLARLVEAWAARPVYTLGDGLMVVGVALFLLMGWAMSIGSR